MRHRKSSRYSHAAQFTFVRTGAPSIRNAKIDTEVTPTITTRMMSDIHSFSRKRLIQFYERHNPDKAVFADTLLQKYKGREHELCQRLHEKHNGFMSTSGRDGLEATQQPDDQSISCGYVPPLLRSQ